jgi:hypothetical protein
MLAEELRVLFVDMQAKDSGQYVHLRNVTRTGNMQAMSPA